MFSAADTLLRRPLLLFLHRILRLSLLKVEINLFTEKGLSIGQIDTEVGLELPADGGVGGGVEVRRAEEVPEAADEVWNLGSLENADFGAPVDERGKFNATRMAYLPRSLSMLPQMKKAATTNMATHDAAVMKLNLKISLMVAVGTGGSGRACFCGGGGGREVGSVAGGEGDSVVFKSDDITC
nr:hypothetical protein Iba_chr02aCG3060 [Ipomoea batatas]